MARAGLCNVAYLWARGHSFLEILKNTNMFEGSVIRIMR